MGRPCVHGLNTCTRVTHIPPISMLHSSEQAPPPQNRCTHPLLLPGTPDSWVWAGEGCSNATTQRGEYDDSGKWTHKRPHSHYAERAKQGIMQPLCSQWLWLVSNSNSHNQVLSLYADGTLYLSPIPMMDTTNGGANIKGGHLQIHVERSLFGSSICNVKPKKL